jgi:hypothetical protein
VQVRSARECPLRGIQLFRGKIEAGLDESFPILLIRAFEGPLGKVSAELIAEGQSEPQIIRKWFDNHIRQSRSYL